MDGLPILHRLCVTVLLRMILWPSCDHTFFSWYDHPGIFDNLLEIVCEHSGTILCMVYDHSWIRDDRLPSWNCGWFISTCMFFDSFTEDYCDHPVTILCMVYDHPELGMIDYHPGNVDGLSQPSFCVWNFYWGWLWPSCDSSGLPYSLWYDYPINFGNLLEMVFDHPGFAVVLFSTEFFILTGVWHWRSSLV